MGIPSSMRPKGGKTKFNDTMNGQLLQDGTQRHAAKQCTMTDTHSYDMLLNTCNGWSAAVGPLSATVVPFHSTQFVVPFVKIFTTVWH